MGTFQSSGEFVRNLRRHWIFFKDSLSVFYTMLKLKYVSLFRLALCKILGMGR